MRMLFRLQQMVGKAIAKSDLGILRAIESLLVSNCSDELEMPVVAVCGCPRSGHTLTAQVITQGVKVFSIDNLQSVFYRTPVVGYRLSKWLLHPHVSDYKSKTGLVSALSGLNSGAFLWCYWCDMRVAERPPQPDPDRLREFSRLLNNIYRSHGLPYCARWLGFAFYFKELLAVAKHHIIVRTQRDLLSTAASILPLTRGKKGEYAEKPFSLQPRECQDQSVMARMSAHDRVARQVYFVNRRMDEQVATGRYRVFDSMYHELCADPRSFIARLIEFAGANSLALERRTDVALPPSFSPTRVQRNRDEDTRKLANALEALQDQYGPVSVPLEPEGDG